VPLLSQKDYARRRGVTPQYVNKLVRQGKILLVGKKVDIKQADAAIKAFSRPAAYSASAAQNRSRARPKPQASTKGSRSMPCEAQQRHAIADRRARRARTLPGADGEAGL
jgi:hypothetical protein